MKTLTADVQASIVGSGSTLIRLIEFKLINGTVLYLTDSDVNIIVGGNTYYNEATVSQVQLVLGASTQSGAVDVLLGGQISTSLIEAGALDNARFSIKVLDYTKPTSVPVVFYVGFVSKVTYKDRLTATIEGQPLSSRGQPLASDTFSMNCRADLGDAKCRVNIDALKQVGCAVTVYNNGQKFSATFTDGSWNNGLVVFTSGQLNGYSFEVAKAAGGAITLKGIMPFAPAAGDTFTLYPGCDKTVANCKSYANILNYQGEPFSISPYTATVKPVAAAVAAPASSGSSAGTVGVTATPAATPATKIAAQPTGHIDLAISRSTGDYIR